MLFTFSSPGIYTKYIQLPCTDAPVHDSILNNLKFYLFFEDMIGAIDVPHLQRKEIHHEITKDSCHKTVSYVVTLTCNSHMYSVAGKA